MNPKNEWLDKGNKMKLTKEEFLDATLLGIKAAVLEMLDSQDIIRTEQFMEKVREGIQDAILEIVSESKFPDFSEVIIKGIQNAFPSKEEIKESIESGVFDAMPDLAYLKSDILEYIKDKKSESKKRMA